MQDFSAIDDYFDQVVRGLPYDKLARIERKPAGFTDPNAVLGPLGAKMPEKQKIIGVDSPVQREDSTVIESETPRPIDTYGYESKVKEIPFLAENLNASIEDRMATKDQLTKNISGINDDVEGGRNKISALIAQMEGAGSRKYEPNSELEQRILKAEKDYGSFEQAPRDLLSEAIVSFGPAILGGLLGSSGQIAQKQASQDSRSLYEGARKEEGDRLMKLKEMAGRRYQALLRIKQDDRESWTKEQESELNRVDKIRQANADILKADISDREKQEGRVLDIDKELAQAREKGTLAIGEMGSKAEQAEAKLEFDKQMAAQKSQEQKERDKFHAAEAMKRTQVMAGTPMGRLVMARSKEERERKMDLLERQVPGFTMTGEVMPSKGEAEKLRTAVGVFENLKSATNKMKDLVKENGSFEFMGQNGAAMRAAYGDLQMSLKNLYELGAITGPDMEILGNQLSDPSSIKSIFSRDSTRQAELESLISNLETRVKSNLAAKGYVPKQSTKLTPEQRQKLINDLKAKGM